MNNVVPLTPNKRDWKWHRDRIAAAWGKQVESIIEAGQHLINAKEDEALPHGSFEAMIQRELPFGKDTAQILMKIARNTILTKAEHVRLLPPSWGTLNELTKLPPDILLAKLKDGSIHPKLERKDARAMRPNNKEKDKPKPATRDELIAAIQKEPNANQREAAEKHGVSVGVYQRTRNELIGSGEIKGSLTIDELRERMAELLRKLPKEDRMREITRTMKAVDLNIHDWVSTMTIGRK